MTPQCTQSQEKRDPNPRGCEEGKFAASFASAAFVKLLCYSGECWGEQRKSCYDWFKLQVGINVQDFLGLSYLHPLTSLYSVLMMD